MRTSASRVLWREPGARRPGAVHEPRQPRPQLPRGPPAADQHQDPPRLGTGPDPPGRAASSPSSSPSRDRRPPAAAPRRARAPAAPPAPTPARLRDAHGPDERGHAGSPGTEVRERTTIRPRTPDSFRRRGARGTITGWTTQTVERVRAAVRAIPPGQVRSYSEIAAETGLRSARLVGRVLAVDGHDLPWHRVVRADGSFAPHLAAEAGRPPAGRGRAGDGRPRPSRTAPPPLTPTADAHRWPPPRPSRHRPLPRPRESPRWVYEPPVPSGPTGGVSLVFRTPRRLDSRVPGPPIRGANVATRGGERSDSRVRRRRAHQPHRRRVAHHDRGHDVRVPRRAGRRRRPPPPRPAAPRPRGRAATRRRRSGARRPRAAPRPARPPAGPAVATKPTRALRPTCAASSRPAARTSASAAGSDEPAAASTTASP